MLNLTGTQRNHGMNSPKAGTIGIELKGGNKRRHEA